MDFWHPGAKKLSPGIYLPASTPCQNRTPMMIKMAAVSSCLLLLQPYWTIQNDNLACGSNSDWTGPSLTEGVAEPPGSLSFARASVSSLSLHSSSAKFISPECPSYTSTLCTLPRESISSCQEKGKVPWGRFKEKLKLKVCNVVRAGERRGNVGMRDRTVVEPRWGTLRSNLCLPCLRHSRQSLYSWATAEALSERCIRAVMLLPIKTRIETVF